MAVISCAGAESLGGRNQLAGFWVIPDMAGMVGRLDYLGRIGGDAAPRQAPA